MRGFGRDLLYGARMLARNRGLTLVVLLTLALGIGATTAVFTVLNAVLLRALPFDNPDELVMVRGTYRPKGILGNPVSYPAFRDWEARNDVFAGMAILRNVDATLSGDDAPERLEGARVSAGFFPLLRVRPHLGRLFREEDDQPGSEGVVILSHRLWDRRFGASSEIVGRSITLNGAPHTVVGVLPAGFRFPFDLSTAEVWTPVAGDVNWFPQRGSLIAHVVARLKPGVSRERAQREMDILCAQVEKEHPQYEEDRGAHLVPLHEEVVGDVRKPLLLLFAAVSLVLLIGCVNVANLLLARGAAREREFAIRAALGAGRGRLAQQLLAEGLLLSVLGGAAGLLAAVWGTDALLAMVPGDLPRLSEIGVDAGVLLFNAAASLVAGVMFGFAPALAASRRDVQAALKEGGQTGASPRRRLRSVLVAAEVALALLLMVGSGLLLRSFLRVTDVPPGFQPENTLTFRVVVSGRDVNQLAGLYGEVLDRLKELPGVVAAGASTSLPVAASRMEAGYAVAGEPPLPPGQVQSAVYDVVTPDFFRALGIPLLAGRTFTEEDARGRPGVIVINRAMADKHWPGRSPLGERIKLSVSFNAPGEPQDYEVAGVVENVRDRGLEAEAPVHMYVPYRQQTWPFFSFVLRTASDPAPLIAAVRSQVAGVTRETPVFNVRTMEQHLAEHVARRRFAMLLVTLFAGVALALSAVGVYGVTSFSVSQRTREIGVRMALGARTGAIHGLVMRQGLAPVLAGAAAGMAGSLVMTRWLESLLFEVAPTDAPTLAGVFAVLLIVSALACYFPARRASRTDVLASLRCE